MAVLAGAMTRMLVAFGVFPTQAALLALAGAAGFLSARLKATRFVVPLITSIAYFATWMFTQNPEQAVAVNPGPWDLARNSADLFIPFVAPALGSAFGLWLERWKDSRAQAELDKEVTEESLLAEKLPEVPQHLKYDLSDLE
ncbi:MAG: hypothetical protein SFV51_28015 [Bryobacteraceae bacterium]|nr:hypothetical protein [Bryobacteraceae bacterium]